VRAHHNMRTDAPLGERGFTIIELMIATTVFSMILVMVSAMMIGVGKLYNKGINQSRVQSNVRSITDEVSQQLRLSAKDSVLPQDAVTTDGVTSDAICIGKYRYSFVVNKKLGDWKHVLWRDDKPATGCATLTPTRMNSSAPSTGLNGTELIAANSRLTAFTITGGGKAPYTVEIGVTSGDYDAANQDNSLSNASGQCTGDSAGKGTEYCASAKIKTIVAQRIIGS